MLPRDVDRETRLREISDAARQGRKRPPRALWIAALALFAVCVGGLAIAWYMERDTPPLHRLPAAQTSSTGFGIGLVIGAGVGIALGSLLVLRRKG